MKKTGTSRTAKVRAALILKGITMKEMARRAGVTPRMLAYVLQDQRHSPRVQKAVAKVVRIKFEELWG